jgi:hypothetical protein
VCASGLATHLPLSLLPELDDEGEPAAILQRRRLLRGRPLRHRGHAGSRRRRGRRRHRHRRRRVGARPERPAHPPPPIAVAAEPAVAAAAVRLVIPETERGLPQHVRAGLVLVRVALVVRFGGFEPEDEDGGGRVRAEEPAVEVPRDPDAAAGREVQPLAAAELPPEPAHLEGLLAVDGDPHGGALHGEGHVVPLARDVDGGRVGLASPVGDDDGALPAGEEQPRRGRVVPDGQRQLAVHPDAQGVPGHGLRPAPGGGEARARQVPRELDGAAARRREPLGPAPPPREPRPEREPRGRGVLAAVDVPGGAQAELRGQEEADRGAGPRQRDAAEVGPVDRRRRGGRRRRGRVAAGEAGERHGVVTGPRAGRGRYGDGLTSFVGGSERGGVVVAPVQCVRSGETGDSRRPRVECDAVFRSFFCDFCTSRMLPSFFVEERNFPHAMLFQSLL